MIEIQSNIADKQETVVWLNKHISELGKEKQELEKDIIRLGEIKMDLEQQAPFREEVNQNSSISKSNA